MTTKKLFDLLIICTIAALVSGCEYIYGSKALDYDTLYVGYNGPDLSSGSYYRMKEINTLTNLTSAKNSWLKSALPADVFKEIIDETDFEHQFILIL